MRGDRPAVAQRASSLCVFELVRSAMPRGFGLPRSLNVYSSLSEVNS